MKKYIDLIQKDIMFENGTGGVLVNDNIIEEKVIPVDLVTVYALIPIFKEGNEANAIQVARVKNSKGEELQYDIIVGKGLWTIGDTGIYIQPDYCLPYTKHFLEYTQPGGDPAKSKLGKKNRVKAIKFNFTFENGDGPIYSNGVLLPMDNELKTLVSASKDLMTDLQITKYVSEDSLDVSQNSGNAEEFPSFLYKTDEPTIQNKKGLVETCFQEGMMLMGTIKRDGCLQADTLIKTEFGEKTIKEIVETRYSGKIATLNLETNQVELKKISNFKVNSEKKQWYLLELEDGIQVRVTGNHMIWLPDLSCYRRVDELDGNENILLER